LFVFIVLLSLVYCFDSFALEKPTHQTINEEIAQRTINGFSLTNYLKDNLGFIKGVGEEISGYSGRKNMHITQKVWQWLGEGGFMEDEPGTWYDYVMNNNDKTRSRNHFHNPLKPWDQAGLDDYVFGHRIGQSSILWAQNQNQDVGAIGRGMTRESIFILR